MLHSATRTQSAHRARGARGNPIATLWFPSVGQVERKVRYVFKSLGLNRVTHAAVLLQDEARAERALPRDMNLAKARALRIAGRALRVPRARVSTSFRCGINLRGLLEYLVSSIFMLLALSCGHRARDELRPVPATISMSWQFGLAPPAEQA